MSTLTNTLLADALSDDWRIAPSQHQALDLANSIRSLQKVISLIDDRKCMVTYNHTDESYFRATDLIIRIDPAFAMKSSPINGNDFDVLAGLGVHEGLHSQCHSDSIRQNGTETYKGIVRIGEEIYIDNYGLRNYPILGKYIRKSRNGYKVEESLVAWDDIYMTWCAIAVYGIMPQGDWLHDTRKVAMLKLLMELSVTLMEKDISTVGREELYKQTAGRLEQMVVHQSIEDRLSKNKSQEPVMELDTPFGLSNVQEQGGKEKSSNDEKEEETKNNNTSVESDTENEAENEETEVDGKEDAITTPVQSSDGTKEKSDNDISGDGESTTNPDSTGSTVNALDPLIDPLSNDGILDGPGAMSRGIKKIDLLTLLHPNTAEMPAELLQTIAEVMESGIEDLTAIMDSTYDMTSGGTVIWSKAESKIDTDFDEKLARQLVWVKDWKNTIGHQTYRQEPRGKLDGTRLYRASIDQKVFKTRVMVDNGDLDLVMLCDASTSMMDKTSIYKDAKALHRTLPEAIVISYQRTGNGQIDIRTHTQGRMFKQIIPLGGTPTAEALAATALKFPNALIIHFTDGGCKQEELEDLFPKIHKQHPRLKMVHIQLSQYQYGSYRAWNTIDPIPEFEGMSKTVMMDKIEEFPGKLREILRQW